MPGTRARTTTATATTVSATAPTASPATDPEVARGRVERRVQQHRRDEERELGTSVGVPGTSARPAPASAAIAG